MPRHLRITIVVMDVGPVGGMERQLSELILGFLAADHHVTVISRTCDLDTVAANLRFVRVPVPQRPFALAFPLFIAIATPLTARHRGHVVHVNGGIVLNRADVYTMHFCHRAYQREHRQPDTARRDAARRLNGWVSERLKRWMETLVLRVARVRRVVAISDGVERETARAYPSTARRIEVIPYGVDHGRFRPDAQRRTRRRAELGLDADQLAAVFVGGDWGRKGLDLAIAALAGAPGWFLLVVGVGDEAAYRQVAAEHGVVERMRFLGREARPEATYNAGDAFVFPTSYETFSLVTHEAAACGLPLLVNRVHGVDDLLVDGESGWFIERDAHDIARRLRALAENPEERTRMGARATADAERYDWSKAVEDHLALYHRMTP